MAVSQRTRKNFDLWDHLDRFMTPSFQRMDNSLSDWNPKVDIVEKPGAWEIHAELPGVAKDDIELHVENGVVTVSGSCSQKTVEGEGVYRRIERSYGSFKRSFTLPDNAEVSSPLLQAKLEDGVLEVTIPKKTQEVGEKKSIPIPITTASETIGVSGSSSSNQKV